MSGARGWTRVRVGSALLTLAAQVLSVAELHSAPVSRAKPTPAASALCQDEPIAWLRNHAIPLATTEAGHGFEDLEPLKAIIGDARIVALGEGTHGTREFFQMKHRLLEFLASEMGFTIFSIEASTPEAYELDDYVLGGPGDPKKLIGGMYFWTWNTEEVLAMVEWMRAFHASGKGTVHFTGFDMQTPDVAMQVVTDFLGSIEPERAEDVRFVYSDIKNAQPAGDFGVATGTFPVEAARGKHLRFKGWIRTEDLQGGVAALWWRNDSPDGQMTGLESMEERAPRGTSDWAEYALEFDVPADTVNINFGFLMTGHGKAWFDSISIEVDGQPYLDPEHLDLGFEERMGDFVARAPGYRVGLTDAVEHEGSRSLCIESLARDASVMDPGDAAEVAREVREGLESDRQLFLSKADAKAVEWAIHNARIVEQCLRSRARDPQSARDRSMAENVAWILEQNPGARIVLWAHNGHVCRAPGAMGAYLSKQFGDDYLPLAFATSEGRYTAQGDQSLTDHPLAPPPADSVESLLAQVGQPRLLLDLRLAEPGAPGSRWAHESRPFRSIGALAQEAQFFPVELAKAYALLVYVKTTSASIQLDTAAGRR